MTERHGKRRSYAARIAASAAFAALCLSLPCSAADATGTECLYEFNKAYSWNQSGQEQLKLGNRQAAQLNTDAAKSRYEQAVTLLEKSIKQYEQLPELAFDCSPANLSIARNNIRIARENLALAREALGGMGCLKALDELESLTDLASEYYYDHKDPASARQSADDAVALAESIAEQGICTGGYRETLAEQTRYAREVADSLHRRSRYERCMKQLELAHQSIEQASRAHSNEDNQRSRRAWQQALETTEKTVGAGHCEGVYRQKAIELRNRARRHLNNVTGDSP